MAERSMLKPDIVIQEWPISFYIEKKRLWVYGMLLLKSTHLIYKSNDDQKVKTCVTIKLSDISDVTKAKTGLVFGAIVIHTTNKDKFWISSFEDREGVFASLQHFWRSQLQLDGRPGSVKGGKTGSNNSTKMGQDLLRLANDSQKTLSNAGTQLHEQGRQLDYALGTMHDLHSDLDIADHLVEDLQAWVGRWSMPQAYQSIDPVFVNLSDVPEVFEFEILFTKLETGKPCTQRLGLLRISKDGLIILTDKQRTVHHFRWTDVSQLRVITPWEIMVIQFQIGKPDTKFSLVCSNMVAILKLLEKCAKYKLQYDTAPDTVLCHHHGNQIGRNLISENRNPAPSNSHVLDGRGGARISGHPISDQSQLLIDQSGQAVSEKEAEELSHALTGLKSLALDVQKKELDQDEKLDRLTATVDRANDRLAKTDRKMNRML